MSEAPAPQSAEPPPRLPPPPRHVEMRLGPLIRLWLLRAIVHPLFVGVGVIVLTVFVLGITKELERVPLFSGTILLLAAGVLCMGVWSYFAVVGGTRSFWLTPWRNRRIFSHGQVVTGTLVGKTVTEIENENDYGLTYEYTDTAGRKHTQQNARVAFRHWNAMYESQQVTVLYDPKRPEVSFLYEAADYIIK